MNEDRDVDDLHRALNTRWMVDWIRRNDAVREVIEFVHETEPAAWLDRDMAMRIVVLRHLGVIPLPEGARMELVVHAVESLLASVDWGSVDRQLTPSD